MIRSRVFTRDRVNETTFFNTSANIRAFEIYVDIKNFPFIIPDKAKHLQFEFSKRASKNAFKVSKFHIRYLNFRFDFIALDFPKNKLPDLVGLYCQCLWW